MSVYSGSAEGRLIAQKIVDSEYRTMAALAHASRTLDNVPIDEKRRVEIDKSLVIVGDCIGVCEKIYTSPVPLVCECNFKWCHSVTDV
jgi:putative membrane protein